MRMHRYDPDDVDVDDDDELATNWFCECSNSIWSNSNLIEPHSATDSLSQMLTGDQMIAFELDRLDFIDKFNGVALHQFLQYSWQSRKGKKKTEIKMLNEM